MEIFEKFLSDLEAFPENKSASTGFCLYDFLELPVRNAVIKYPQTGLQDGIAGIKTGWTCPWSYQFTVRRSYMFWNQEEKSACGVGFVASKKGIFSHDHLQQGLHALRCVEHRGACAADAVTGDGAGILTDIPF